MVLALVGAVGSGLVRGLEAQTQDEWRVRFAAGEEAREAGDHAAYAREMAAAARALPEGQLNRPFLQYHAARAAALDGRPADAIGWLRMAWDEDIESLMISFAPYDPAFSDMLDSSDFRAVMALASDMTLSVRHLGGRVHLLQGAGANVLAHVSDGVFLVDTGYAPALPAVRRALEGLGARSVDMLLITHPHEDHMGAAADLGATTTLIAHPGTSAQMKEPYVFMPDVTMPPKPERAFPDIEVTRDTVFEVGGEAVRVVPTVAHTTGDLSVYFTESHVVHFGDTYLAGNPMMFPGSEDPDGFLDRLEAFIDAMDPATIVVGGHEEPTDLDAVRRQIEVSRSAMAFVRASIADGLDLEATARAGADRFPPQWLAYFYGVFTQPGS